MESFRFYPHLLSVKFIINFVEYWTVKAKSFYFFIHFTVPANVFARGLSLFHNHDAHHTHNMYV